MMEKNGLYARLYLMQFRNPEEEFAATFTRPQTQPAHIDSLPEKRPGLLGMLGMPGD